MSQLVTGEAVVLDLPVAGVPSRVLAALLDAAVQAALGVVGALLVGIVAPHSSQAVVAGLLIVVVLLPLLVYPVAMETLARGRTLGKLALGLRVVRDDGGPIGFRQAITRGLLGLFVEKPGFTWGVAAVVTALVNGQGKRLGDLAAGTLVVRERVARRRDEPVTMPAPLAGWATSLDLGRLDDQLAHATLAYLGRRSSLTEAAQRQLDASHASAMAAVVSPPPPPDAPAWAYLAAVLAERRRRQQQPLTPPEALPPALLTPAAAPPTQVTSSPFAPPE